MISESRPPLPQPRGPVSDAVIRALGHMPHSFRTPWVEDLDLLTSDDAQLALACCYELHYQSFQGVDDEWEWSTDLVVSGAATGGDARNRQPDHDVRPPPPVARGVCWPSRTLRDDVRRADGPVFECAESVRRRSRRTPVLRRARPGRRVARADRADRTRRRILGRGAREWRHHPVWCPRPDGGGASAHRTPAGIVVERPIVAADPAFAARSAA